MYGTLRGMMGSAETLRHDGEYGLLRVERDEDRSVLVVTLPSEQLQPRSIERLRHEYALRDELDAAWAAKPLELAYEHGCTFLVRTDPGGDLLSGLIGRPWDTATFLRIAIGISVAVGRVHARGLIHKDIKPDNLLVDPATGAAWLTGFGIASRLPRERQAPEPPEVISGTLAYMAPEQTGRMNRSVDARSDLYALGVTLYQMLTGELPFAAADPMELVHCHIARPPVPPVERVAGIAPAISAIVMKLLAKTPEDRYQTAAGVSADLQLCLTRFEADGYIEPFPLARHDIPDVVRIPEKLYGREREVSALLSAFERVIARGQPELVLVSGYSGIGKSSVVNELHKAIVPARGLFVSGKFEQYRRDIPYATLAQGFQALVRQLLGGSEAEVDRWRRALRDALEPNGALMVAIIPELELIIGRQPPVAELPPQEAQARFQRVFRRLIGVFARPEHPLVLFLDDLQWLDAATLTLIVDLATQSDVRHLLLIGAYRNNEVGASHPLMRSIEAIRAAGAPVAEIVLAPLAPGDVAALIADSLDCDDTRGQPLALLVYEKTAGNPFFAIQFLTALAEEKLLSYDAAAGCWNADLDRIRAKGQTDNVVDLMLDKLTRLPEQTQHSLKQLACLGSAADCGTLGLVCDQPDEAVHASLWHAVRDGLVLRQDESYAFLHDRVQEAAYSLIDPGERPHVHLRIGRLLLSRMRPEQVIHVANQLNLGAALLVEQDERKRVAELNLRAGRRAKASTAYASACAYLAAGMALLDPDVWDVDYELAFALWLERAECESLSGNFDSAEALIAQLLARGESRVDKAAAYRLKIDLHVMRSENAKAIESALACLRLLGIEMAAHPTREQVEIEYEKVWRNLGERPIESLIDLPRMTHPEMQAAMQVLGVLFAPAYFTDRNLVQLHICHMINLTLEHGTSDAAAHAYACFGVTIGPNFRRYIDGYRFCKLACDLVEKLDLIAYKAKVYFLAEMGVLWTQPVTTALDYIRAAHRAAVEAGDPTFACYSCNHTVTDLLLRGDHLDDVWRETERGLEFARRAKFRDVVDIIVAQQRFIENLRGRTASFFTFCDADFDEAAFEADLTEERMSTMICWYWIIKLQARYLFGDYDAALAAARKAEALLWSSDGHIQLLDYHFCTALTLTASWESVAPDRRPQVRAEIEAHLAQLREWAENGSVTFRDRHALLCAEVARIEGRVLESEELYEDAIRISREHNFVHDEALANELAARFHAARGLETIASAYLRNARLCYLRWGAAGKVRQLDERHPQLRAEAARLAAVGTTAAAAESLELASVIKMSQAVSGEIVLERLVEKLMSIALEHAGAQRGLLILRHGDAHWIEAEAAIGGEEQLELGMRHAPVTAQEMPESILRYVVRTHEAVLLDDAGLPNLYSSDPYLVRSSPRSILCLPLLKQTQLIGVLYLENQLTAGVFTPARIGVLDLLASQAAISLDNARLYAELQKENAERRQSEQALRRSEERYALAVEAAGDGHTDWIVATDELYASPRLLDMLGLPRNTRFSGRGDFLNNVRFHPEDRQRALRTLDDYYVDPTATRLEFEARILRAGETRWLHTTVLCSRDATGAVQRSSSAITDITERKLAEEALRQSEERFALAVAGANEGIFDWNLRTDQVYLSLRAQELLGVPVGELWRQRREWREILKLHPDDRKLQRDSIRALITGETTTHDVEFRVVLPDGSQRWFRQRAMGLTEKTGKAYRVVGSIGDITDRKRAQEDLLQLERRLRQAQRLEAMGTLAGGIAHDFNNILGSVLGYGERALRAAPTNSPLARYLDHIVSAGERGRMLVDRILAFSSNREGERISVHVEKVVAEGLDLLAGKLPARVRIEPELRAGRAAVLGDPTQLHRVLMNLATNAMQAMPHGGLLHVRLELLSVRTARLATVGSLEPGDYVVLSVTDEGTGMPSEVLERIFDPFFTTKEAGGGTGLGLSLVHGIVVSMDGAIEVTTAHGKGSTFTVFLPRSGSVEVAPPGQAPVLPLGRQQRVMVVDDEKALVDLSAEILEELGYQALGFTSAEAALEAFRADGETISAVITDERMPGMTGTALVRALRALRRDIPILLMSGYVGGQVASRAREAGADEVLKKPLLARDLHASLARLLPL